MGIDWIVLSYLPTLEGQLTHFQCTNKILKINDLKFILQRFWETGTIFLPRNLITSLTSSSREMVINGNIWLFLLSGNNGIQKPGDTSYS